MLYGSIWPKPSHASHGLTVEACYSMLNIVELCEPGDLEGSADLCISRLDPG